jgi:polyisoprenyl-teichoic acid--peptidoglycan teichoic acid transferase
VLTRYESIARSSKDIVFTDIPGSLLPAFVDLSMKVQRGAQVRSIAFTNKIIHPWDPDYDLIRTMVAKAIRSSGTEQVSGPAEDPPATPDDTSSPDPSPSPSGSPTGDSDDESASPSPSTSGTPAPGGDSLDDACAYHPAVD